MIHLLFASIVLLAATSRLVGAENKDWFRDWPSGASPASVGRRIAEGFIERPFDFQRMNRQYVFYAETCAWYGALSFAQLTRDTGLARRLIAKYDVLLTPEGDRMIRRDEHVDFSNFGMVPLEIYLHTKDASFLKAGLPFADRQREKTTADGVTAQARYWIDDVYMINVLQIQAWRATGYIKYLDQAAVTTTAYLDRLQQPNGLFFHADDSRFYWARGNGWFAAGMAELLHVLPVDHATRPRILAGFRSMMAALLEYQRDDGLWRQLIDRPDFWPETSGTAMFAFALVNGVKNGWLDGNLYGPAARKAWLGLVDCLLPNGNLREVCIGTNKAAAEVGPDPAKQLEFYRDRPRRDGNLHGQAPMLWTAAALMR